MTEALAALCGVGLVLFGLRAFAQALDDNLVARLRPLGERVLQGPASALGAGFFATLGLQASSITVIATMGLLQRWVLTLEQAVLVMLGATVGTSLKAWLFVLPFGPLGMGLVGGASVALVVARRYGRRKTLELLFALGVVFLGWHLVTSALEPVLARPDVVAWLGARSVSTLSGLMFTVAVGFVGAAAVQSSSSVVFLVTALTAQGVLSVPVAAALVLGANVGTTMTPLYASVEYRPDVRRLAVAHVVVKAVGVAAVGLFFRTFLEVVAATVSAAGGASDAVVVVGVHAGFNLVNAMVWVLLLPVLLRVLQGRPGEADPLARFVLTAPVRRLLANLPEEALEKVMEERDRALRDLKVRLDRLLAVLATRAHEGTLKPTRDLKARVMASQEMLAAIVARDAPGADRARAMLVELNALEDILDEMGELMRRLDVESARYSTLRRTHLVPVFEALGEETDALWGWILGAGGEGTPDGERWARIEGEAQRLLRGEHRVGEAEVLALGRQISHLQRIWMRLTELAAAAARRRATAPAPEADARRPANA